MIGHESPTDKLEDLILMKSEINTLNKWHKYKKKHTHKYIYIYIFNNIVRIYIESGQCLQTQAFQEFRRH
jgi:hypothetical protein